MFRTDFIAGERLPHDEWNEAAGKLNVIDQTLSDISYLNTYSGGATAVNVIDKTRGGYFYKSSIGTVDNGIIFPASGGGYWNRHYDESRGVSADWWGNDASSISKAISVIGPRGIINLTPNKTYLQYDEILLHDGQAINGNSAILKRASGADAITSLSQDAQLTDSAIHVTSVPARWKVGDYLQIYQDSTVTSSISYKRLIIDITGNVVTFSGAIGVNAYPYAFGLGNYQSALTIWAAGITKVRKVFTQLTTPGFLRSDSSNNAGLNLTNFTIKELIFDGNRSQNNENHSWYVNAVMECRGYKAGVLIDNCTFTEIPNDCIDGHGFRLINSRAYGLNGSFVHLSATADSYGEPQIPAFIQNNFVDGVNQVAQYPNQGHTEGAITYSFSPGYVNIQNNRFFNGGEAFMGVMQSGIDISNMGARQMIISGNYCKNFESISHFGAYGFGDNGFGQLGSIYIDGNVFEDCGYNDLTPLKDQFDNGTDAFVFGQNIASGTTTLILPPLKSDKYLRYPTKEANSVNYETTTTPADPTVGNAVTWFDGLNLKAKKNIGGTITSATII